MADSTPPAPAPLTDEAKAVAAKLLQDAVDEAALTSHMDWLDALEQRMAATLSAGEKFADGLMARIVAMAKDIVALRAESDATRAELARLTDSVNCLSHEKAIVERDRDAARAALVSIEHALIGCGRNHESPCAHERDPLAGVAATIDEVHLFETELAETRAALERAEAKAEAYDAIITREEAKADDRADHTNWHALCIDRTHALERVEARLEAHEKSLHEIRTSAFEAGQADADQAGRALVAAAQRCIHKPERGQAGAIHDMDHRAQLARAIANAPTRWGTGEEPE